jgi:hypothetical protein
MSFLLPKVDDMWIAGLDLGQAQDFTAMVVLKRTTVETTKEDGTEERHREYDCPAIHRWPLGTLYPDIIKDLQKMLPKLPDLPERPRLVVDGTGCGRPVVDMIRQAKLPVHHLSPVSISSGATTNEIDGYRSVPKRDLVGATMGVAQRGYLHINRDMPMADILVKELRAFRALITLHGKEKYENDWRVAPHDDLVLALALALHYGETVATCRPWLIWPSPL